MNLQSATSRSEHFSALLPVACLLLVYILTRVDNLLAMPPFIDEFLHIQWAQDVYRGHFFTGAANGRLLALWWMSLFQLSGDNLLWLTRTATLLVGTVGVAVVYSLARVLSSRFAGLLAAVFYILAPFTFFHDRLGLSDAYVSTLGILSLWFSVRFAFRGRDLSAILAGLTLTAAVAAKATGLMLVITPAIALLLLVPFSRWRQAVRGIVLAYGAFIITWVPFYLLLRVRGWSYFGVAVSVVGTDRLGGLLERFSGNVGAALMMDIAYLSLAMTLLFCVLTAYLVVRHWRIGLFLTLSSTVPLAALLAFATKVSGRYILFHIPALIVSLAVGLAVTTADLRRHRGLLRTIALPLAVAVPLVWGILFALPFQAQMRSDPASVGLPSNDRLEYIFADSSGFALNKAADYLLKLSPQNKLPIHVVGLLANCGGLALYIPGHSPVTVECPYITYDGSQQRALADLVNRRATEATDFDLWIASENSPYISLDGITVPYERVVTFDRPGDLLHVSLYHVRKPR
jgi:hypothetical protein